MTDKDELIQLIKDWFDKQEPEGCDITCKYFYTGPWDHPCNKCRRNHKDYYEYQERPFATRYTLHPDTYSTGEDR